MQPTTVADLFALALLLGLAGVAVAAAVPRVRALVITAALPLAATVATAAMLGSLYFSEVADFVPCKLCWFQRIAMYPLAPVLVLASIWRDRTIMRYVVPLSLLGFAVSAYHVWIQWFPEQSNFCEFDNPCSATWVKGFDVFSIPQLAGLSFALIASIGALSMISERAAQKTSEPV